MLVATLGEDRRPVMGRFIRTTVATLVVAWLGLLLASMIAALTRRSGAHIPDESSDELDIVAVYDQLDFTSRATDLRRGTVELWFGGGTVDLRGATLAPGGATITTRSVFGGGALVVPDDWNVTTRIVGIGGGGARGARAQAKAQTHRPPPP